MKTGRWMYFFSAVLAILGSVAYHHFVKRISPAIHPIVSIVGIYVGVLLLSGSLLLVFPPAEGYRHHFRQINWVQLAVAISVFLIELGFVLMYRAGWNLSTANLVTGVVINILLVALGLLLLREKVSLINAIGIVLSIIGVAMISYRP
ncbi:MAG: EamA family transporter [Anaerolineales bacterium]|nr:EamA family transporter [Anaerolineales bacterium]MCS7247778.1 EamA family transporter [Anaerolineales bacterium]MDW8161588.1 EamA family transporter [Anaerolineales bacterium]MDW8448358.1 EamA family transporter [Anaerolineales bacterium]